MLATEGIWVIRFLWLPLLAAILLASGASPAVAPVGASTAADAVQGDVTCDSAVNAVDSLQILRSVAGLGTSAACLPDAGDVNCDDAVNSVDSLRILRHVAGLSNTTPDGCVAIGEPLVEEIPPTSEELIAAALDAGEITYDESLLYRAYALYDLPGLPAEFRSPIIDLEAAIPLFGEIDANEAQLSPQLLVDLAPFRARPNDPISIFNNPPVQTSVVPAAVGATWRSSPAGNARVWVKDTSDAALNQYVAAVSKVWTAFNGVFPYPKPDEAGVPSAAVNPDTAIDFYFVDKATVDPREAYCVDHPNYEHCSIGPNRGGYARTAPKIEGNKSSGYIMLGTDFTGDTLLAGMAHELMHVSQFAYDKDENFWLMDATAHWAADRVMTKIPGSKGYVYRDLGEFFETLDQPLSRDVGNHRYSAFTYFLFASMDHGDAIVKSVWEKAAASGAQGITAVDQALPFRDNFDDFAVRNWNKKPPLTKTYWDSGGDPTFPQYLAPKTKPWFFGFSDERTESDTIAPLASIYYQYTLNEPVIRKVKFTNLATGNPNARIWALIKVGTNQWKAPLELTNTDEKIFCRDLPNDNLTELVIIVSNTNMTNQLGGPKFKLKTDIDGCHGWVGTATGTHLNDSGYYERSVTTANIEWEEEFFLFGCGCRTFFPHGTVNWSWDYNDNGADPPCSDRASGHVAAGVQGPLKIEQMLTLWQDPVNQNQYYYSATGVAKISHTISCAGGGSAYVPAYMVVPAPNIPLPSPTPFPIPTFPSSPSSREDVAARRSQTQFDATASSNLCSNKTFTISKDTVFFSGNCYKSQDDTGYLKYEWSFSRVNVDEP